MSTVLIITSNLGLQYWLTEALAAAGFLVLPAKTPSKARKLLSQLRLPVDLVIMNPNLAGAGEFVELLRRSQGFLRVLAFDSEAPTLFTVSKVIGPQPDAASQVDWVSRVRRILSAAATA